MKVKLLNIVNSKTVIEKMGEVSSYDGKTAYQVAKNIKEIASELESFDKARNAMVIKYGEERDDGNIEVTKDNMEMFNKEIFELLDVDAEINILLLNPEKITGLSPFELIAIDWMLESEKEIE